MAFIAELVITEAKAPMDLCYAMFYLLQKIDKKTQENMFVQIRHYIKPMWNAIQNHIPFKSVFNVVQ